MALQYLCISLDQALLHICYSMLQPGLEWRNGTISRGPGGLWLLVDAFQCSFQLLVCCLFQIVFLWSTMNSARAIQSTSKFWLQAEMYVKHSSKPNPKYLVITRLLFLFWCEFWSCLCNQSKART